MEPRTMLFNLSQPLKYSKDGNFEETLQLEVDPPCFVIFKECSKLAQAFTRALFSNRQMMEQMGEKQQTDQKNTAGEMDAQAVKLLLFASDTDFNSISESFFDLCTKCCTTDQERKIKLRREHIEKMDYNDLINFICQYLSTFTVPSVLSGLADTEGKG